MAGFIEVHFDLFITAIEGGVNYWAEVLEYRWTLDGVPDVFQSFGELRRLGMILTSGGRRA